jgi:SAM-dependent methyltransferase
LKKIIKHLINSPRIGSSAGKTLMFLWLQKDLKNLKGRLGIDLAGGPMRNKRFFKTDKYVCVDVDQSELDIGKRENPDVISINSRIQDFMNNNDTYEADILVCVQTMGTNISFEHEETIKVIKQMYHFLKPGGSMIFNVAENKNINLDQLENQFKEFFNNKFESVKVRKYGAFHITLKNPIHRYNRLLLAYLMNFFSPLRTLFGFKKERIYFACKKKIN